MEAGRTDTIDRALSRWVDGLGFISGLAEALGFHQPPGQGTSHSASPPLGHLIPATWVLGLFWKTVEPSGGGAWPGEVGHW